MVDPPQGNVNPTQGSLLGLLHDGPKTGWDLIQEAKYGLGKFWNMTQSHVYRELSALEKRKLIRGGEPGPRDRRAFTITAAGRRAFRDWLTDTPGDEQLRFPLLVTLWFGRHLDDDTLAMFVEKTRAEHEARLQLYEALPTDEKYSNSVLSFGKHYERAVLAWLDELSF
jgi:DNA-binding PadR family transcriptional regulator